MPVADDDPDDPIRALIAGRYLDAETGEVLQAQARLVVIDESLADREVDLVASLELGRHLAIVSDPNTHAALGARVARALASRFVVQSIVLPAPRPDDEHVAKLAAALEPRTDAIVAVGSGTLNDLCKMVALGRDCPQLVFATAPSMNGYTSLGASITSNGIKRSVRTRTPIAVLFDLAVLASAPPRMIRAGLGDSACRPTAQTDWLLQHLLLDRPYRSVPFALLADDERALFAQTRALVSGDHGALRHLVRILVLSGFGMTICNGSFPASQGEHLMSHYLDARWPPVTPPALHGEQVGVCTVAMAELQDAILARGKAPVLHPSTLDRAALVARFGELGADACWREYELKRFTRARTDELNARLASSWDAIRARLAAVRLDAPAIRTLLDTAGAATTPTAIGCPPALFAEAHRHAREQRNRYTFLDLAADAGLLAGEC